MRNPKSYAISEVFDNAEIDLVFEFYTSKDIKFIGEDLSNILGKLVVASIDESHKPTWTTSILLQEFKAQKSKYTLKVGPQQYNNLKPGLRFLLMWINENATLDHFTGLQVGLAFNHQKLQTLKHISNMDIGKMILKIDENFIFEKFEESKNNAYSMSVKKIIPLSNFINASGVINSMANVFQLPISEHHGIDFTDYTHGNLKFNYIRGKQYSDKPDQIEQVLEYYILTTYQSLNEQDYTSFEESELAKMTEHYLSLKNSWYNSEKFVNENKDLKIMVDLSTNPGVIQTHWEHIRKPLFGILFESGPLKGKFNWDSEEGVFQLKDSKISGAFIQNMELVNCELDGCILEQAQLWATKIKNSRLERSTLVTKNEVSKSMLEMVRADRINKIEESYIKNNGEIINCKVTGSFVKNAGLGKNAKLDESSIVINTREFQPKVVMGVTTPEIRDYKWIKTLRSDDYDDDKGYGNEFKTDY